MDSSRPSMLVGYHVLNTFPNIPANIQCELTLRSVKVNADTNGGPHVSAIDAFLVINELNRRAGVGEGEANLRSEYSSGRR